MVTLKQIAALHIDRFAGGDRDSRSELSYQDVIFRARQACNYVLKVTYNEKMQEGDRSAVTQCIARYELTLQNDPDCAFVTLPEFYAGLPYNRGVHRIFQRALKPSGEPTDTEFTPCDTPATSLKTRTARYPGLHIYWVEGLKIKLYNVFAEPPGANPNVPGTNKVIVQIIVAAPDSIGEDSPLPIMADQQNRILEILAEQEFKPALKVEAPKPK